MVAHVVGTKLKYTMLRVLGWWSYRASLEPPALRKPSHKARGGQAVAIGAAVAGPGRSEYVFPRSMRLLVLRGHDYDWNSLATQSLTAKPEGRPDRLSTPAAMAHWLLLALALGRRPVLPYLPCKLPPHGLPPQHWEAVLLLRNGSYCDRAARAPHWTAASETPLGWAGSSGMTRAQPDAHGCCCMWVPPQECIDTLATRPSGLRGEMVLTESDAGRFVEERRRDAGARRRRPMSMANSKGVQRCGRSARTASPLAAPSPSPPPSHSFSQLAPA